MAPTILATALTELVRRQTINATDTGEKKPTGDWRTAAANQPEELIIEGWSQGFIVGALMVMACVTIANMRRGVLLHKLILLELLLAMSHGTFCFMSFKGYGWYLSGTAAMLYLSWIVHNTVAWLKVRPFFIQPGGLFKAKTGWWVKRVYVGTMICTIPVILFQITDNFRFFNNFGGWYTKVRPYEPLMRDPWWIFTCLTLFHVIRKCYGTGVIGLMRQSPRFAIMLSAITLSIIFTCIDIVASIHSFLGKTDGINPWWKLSLVFKCLTDTIMLDDFKTELKRLGMKRMEKEREEMLRKSSGAGSDMPSRITSADPYASGPRRATFTAFERQGGMARFGSETTFVNRSPSERSKEEDSIDPLSEAPTRETLPKNKIMKVEEVEVATAWRVAPNKATEVSISRRNSAPGERESSKNTTRKIGPMPQLDELKFEPIKAGKSNVEERDIEKGEASPSHSRFDKHEDEEDREENDTSRIRLMAEEIYRKTVVDLDFQRRARALRVAAMPPENDSEDDNEDRRIARFKHSIGVAR